MQPNHYGSHLKQACRCLHTSGPDHDKTLLARRIEATDRQIDRLVYELYGLTDEEIEIVEAGAK
jgi:hypothetical protein